MPAKSSLSTIILVIVIFTQCFITNLHAQNLIYSNSEVLVYSLPENLTSEDVQPIAQKIATNAAREVAIGLVGEAVTILTGNIAGLIYSVIQAIPTVGNAGRIDFDFIPRSINRGYSKFNLSIIFETGDSPHGFSVNLEHHVGLFRWETIESHQLLNNEEVWKIPYRSLIVLKQSFMAPNEFGTYRISVAGVKKQFKITEVTY